jgi:DNA-binding NarL/FixJ family response regulator
MFFNSASTVLIIDDAATVREGLRAMLGMVDITRAESVASAGEAHNRLKSRSYDVVLCDYHLGDGMNGQELLEAMRREGLLPLRTIWIMITGERRYENVVATAEMAPDDYILKPFTSNRLMERLSLAAARKAFLAPAHRLLEGGRVADAIDLLARLAEQDEAPYEHRLNAQRLRAELLIAMRRLNEALEIYLALLSQRIIPWARMGVARIYSEQGRLDEANEILRDIVIEAPLYTDAYDLLAKNLGSDAEYLNALTVLEKAVDISPRNQRRLHGCGMTALRAGQAQKSAEYLQRAIDLSRSSNNGYGPALLGDLLLAYSASGEAQQARKVETELASLCRGQPDEAFQRKVSRALARLAEDSPGDAFDLLATLEPQLGEPWLDFAAAMRFLKAAMLLPAALSVPFAEVWTRQIARRFVLGRNELAEVLEAVRAQPDCCAVAEYEFAALQKLNRHAAELTGEGRVADAAILLRDAAIDTFNVRIGMNACALLLKEFEERQRLGLDGARLEADIHALLAWLPHNNERVKGFQARLGVYS